MATGKLFICLWLLNCGAFALAESGKSPADLEREARARKIVSGTVQSGAPVACDVQVRKAGNDQRFQQYLQSLAAHFPHLPAAGAMAAARLVAHGPEGTLAVLLDVTRGVSDDNGSLIHRPLPLDQVIMLFQTLGEIGTADVPRLFFSMAVDRDPHVFAKKIGEMYLQAETAKQDPRMRAYKQHIMEQLSHVAPDMRGVMAEVVMENPQENLSIVLDITRGVLADDGNTVVKPPLKPSEQLEVAGPLVIELGFQSLASIYNSPTVRRDPVQLYQTMVELVEKKRANQLSEDDLKLIGKITRN